MDSHNLIGGAWLAERYGLKLVNPLAVQSRIGGRRRTELVEGVAMETFVETMRPAPDLRGHHKRRRIPCRPLRTSPPA